MAQLAAQIKIDNEQVRDMMAHAILTIHMSLRALHEIVASGATSDRYYREIAHLSAELGRALDKAGLSTLQKKVSDL